MKKKMDSEENLEMEKTRLISLALEFGFDEESARICLDRLVGLYGDKPSLKQYVSV